jgi:hypothetical protein
MSKPAKNTVEAVKDMAPVAKGVSFIAQAPKARPSLEPFDATNVEVVRKGQGKKEAYIVIRLSDKSERYVFLGQLAHAQSLTSVPIMINGEGKIAKEGETAYLNTGLQYMDSGNGIVAL